MLDFARVAKEEEEPLAVEETLRSAILAFFVICIRSLKALFTPRVSECTITVEQCMIPDQATLHAERKANFVFLQAFNSH